MLFILLINTGEVTVNSGGWRFKSIWGPKFKKRTAQNNLTLFVTQATHWCHLTQRRWSSLDVDLGEPPSHSYLKWLWNAAKVRKSSSAAHSPTCSLTRFLSSLPTGHTDPHWPISYLLCSQPSALLEFFFPGALRVPDLGRPVCEYKAMWPPF